MIRNKEENRAECTERLCREFVETCRSRGIRVTDQRLAVYRALAGDLSHPSADSLYSKVRLQMPSMSLGTLYRTLEFLASEHLIRRVSGTEAVGRFDANLDHHQHLVCRACGMLADIYRENPKGFTMPEVEGFTIEDLDIRFVGICKDCSEKLNT